MKTISKDEWEQALQFPFEADATGRWKLRQKWRTSLEAIENAAKEAQSYLAQGSSFSSDSISLAATCLDEIGEAFETLQQLTIP